MESQPLYFNIIIFMINSKELLYRIDIFIKYIFRENSIENHLYLSMFNITQINFRQ